ncbi:MAG: hypothetical protein ABIG11_07780, partial [bacterium]
MDKIESLLLHPASLLTMNRIGPSAHAISVPGSYNKSEDKLMAKKPLTGIWIAVIAALNSFAYAGNDAIDFDQGVNT